MRISRWATLALLLFPVGASAQQILANTIVVRGEAETHVRADTVVWSVTLQREGASREAAKSAAASEVDRLQAALAAAGVQKRDVTVSEIHVRSLDRERFNGVVSMSISHPATANAVIVKELLEASRLSALTYRFESSRREKAEADAQTQAVAHARIQAASTAQALDASLAGVIAVENEFGLGGAFGTRPRFSVYKATPVAEVTAETFADPTIRVFASVYVTFALGDPVVAL